MGHGDAGSEEPDQSNVDGEPEQTDHSKRGFETSMDLCKYSIAVVIYCVSSDGKN